MEARRQTAQSALLGLCFLDELDDLADDRVNLREVLLHVLLRDGEEHTLSFLHQVGNVDGGIEGFGLYQAGEGDELSLQRLLRDDFGVILDVGRAGYLGIDLHQIYLAARSLEVVGALQLLDDRHDVHGLLLGVERLYGLVDELVSVVVEALRLEQFCHKAVRILFHHECAQHSHFHVEALRLFVSVLVNLRHFYNLRSAGAPSTVLFCFHECCE